MPRPARHADLHISCKASYPRPAPCPTPAQGSSAQTAKIGYPTPCLESWAQLAEINRVAPGCRHVAAEFLFRLFDAGRWRERRLDRTFSRMNFAAAPLLAACTQQPFLRPRLPSPPGSHARSRYEQMPLQTLQFNAAHCVFPSFQRALAEG